jgi:putative copper export protein
VIKLLTFWAAIRLFRALVPLIVILTLALLLLAGVNHSAGRGGGWVGRLQHAARPLEHQLEHALQKASAP